MDPAIILYGDGGVLGDERLRGCAAFLEHVIKKLSSVTVADLSCTFELSHHF